MTVTGAVPAGADLPRLARDLVRVHDAVLSGTRPPSTPRILVERSRPMLITRRQERSTRKIGRAHV